MDLSLIRGAALAVVVLLTVLVVFLLARRFVLGGDHFTIRQTRPVLSSVDGVRYRVHEAHTGPERAADTLARLNRRVVELMRALRARYVRGADGTPAERAAAARLLARYNPDNLVENSPRDPTGDTAYTMDKGAVIALCLRERDPAAGGDPLAYDIHDLGTLTFVTLHEMAHIAINEIDHPAVFWSAFRFLLEEAERAGIYRSPDFAASPRDYCGVHINYNPRMDPNVVPI
jgi:hypothetical protein